MNVTDARSHIHTCTDQVQSTDSGCYILTYNLMNIIYHHPRTSRILITKIPFEHVYGSVVNYEHGCMYMSACARDGHTGNANTV